VRSRLSWKLTATYLLVTILCMAPLGLYLAYSVGQDELLRSHQDLVIRLNAARALLQDAIGHGRTLADSAPIAGELASPGGMTVAVRDIRGRLLWEGSGNPQGTISASRAARDIRRNPGCRVCHQELLDTQELTGTRAIRGPNGSVVGTVRISLPMSIVKGSAWRLRRIILLAVLASICLACFIGARLASGIAQPIALMSAMARRISAGDFSHRVPVPSADEVGELAASLNAMAQRIEEMTAARKAFVADVSHELRTPVASIRALVEALLAGARNDPEEAAEFLSLLESESDRLSNLVRDLLDIAALEARPGRAKAEPVAVADAVRRVCGQLAHQADRAGVRLCMDVPDGLYAMADPPQLERAVANLLDNAVKYTPEGGLVSVNVHRSGNQVLICVADTGMGIPPSEVPRIFERFYRVDKARSRTVGGTGLGLAIVKEIMEANGGAVTVDSHPGRGSQFTLIFPAATAARELPPGTATDPVAAGHK